MDLHLRVAERIHRAQIIQVDSPLRREIPAGSEIGPYKLFRFVFLRKVAEDIVNDAKKQR